MLALARLLATVLALDATARAAPDAAPVDARPAETIERPSAKRAKEWARHNLDRRLKLQTLELGDKTQPLVVLVAYRRLPDWDPDTVVPEQVRGGARLFVFLAAKPVEIKKLGFLSPDDKGGRERPYVNCDEAKVYYLSDKHDPAIVAQSCNELGEYVTRFAVFAAAHPTDPVLGKAATRPGVAIGPQQRFVPGGLPWPSKPSARRGDGKTVVEGTDLEGKGAKARTRQYRIEWDGHGLRRISEDWRPLR
jgi:hypothetical protein